MFPTMEYLAVALGGAAGSVLRYVVSTMFRTAAPGAFPLGTLLVNLLGSFLIGLCAAWVERGAPWVRPWLMAGFLGGFTTFSAFSLENMRLLRDGYLGTALLYALLSVSAGVLLAFAGYAIARLP
jgi:CrcB protein